MNILDYYNNYSKNKYTQVLPIGSANTIDDLFAKCIKPNLLDPKDVIAWHEMLMKYVDLPDAVYWIRYYENGPLIDKFGRTLTIKNNGAYYIKDKRGKIVEEKPAGTLSTKADKKMFKKYHGFRYDTRRACCTQFADGFSYVFVSNYDVHEIFNMIAHHVVPDENEFLLLMKSLTFPLHYDNGASCYESDIHAYPKIGDVHGGVLTEKHWYLAHINSIKNDDCPYIRDNGTISALTVSEKEWLYPLGEPNNWEPIKKRFLNYSLSSEEKELVKAHFLRFVDPLNYFLSPTKKYEKNSVCKSIGEYPYLTAYMDNYYESFYGKDVVEKFRKKARINKNSLLVTGKEILNIDYGINASYPSPVPTIAAATKSTSRGSRVKPELIPGEKLNQDINGYKEYLGKRNYNPKPYTSAIEAIMRFEKLSFDEIFDQIDLLINDYEKGGIKENLGDRQNAGWRNALRRLKDFKNYLGI